jgi:hypothetical protein
MTGRVLAISIPTARRPTAVLPEVCLRSPFPDTNRLSHFRHRPNLSSPREFRSTLMTLLHRLVDPAPDLVHLIGGDASGGAAPPQRPVPLP